jgi:alkanesulfonate monooxygenase SsuD/methylene tetrahydromethanopterin reductase-like flavin-dependent oxidoreductase (luciferase family)
VIGRDVGQAVHVGFNLNNREALIAPGYGVPELIDLGERAEKAGFDSVWVGDSLLSKPRYEPLVLLAALAQRTQSVLLGTACLVTTLRHPVQLAQAWSTLDVLSNGRTILGACSGNVTEDAVKKEFAILRIDRRHRVAIFEEGLKILRALMTEGCVTFHGDEFSLEDVAFSTGMEPAPLLPVQKPPRIWVVANPSIGAQTARGVSSAAARVAELGDGWLTCCRASHPDEVASFVSELGSIRSLDGFDIAYQVTITLGDARADALVEQRGYIDAYYPGFSDAVHLGDWGPSGTVGTVAAWFRDFRDAGVTTFICRFASLDQQGQLERFASEVLPVIRHLTAREPCEGAVRAPDVDGEVLAGTVNDEAQAS